MCNNYRYVQSPHTLFDAFSRLSMPLVWAGGAALNYPPNDNIRIRDEAPVIRIGAEGPELSVMRWAWAGPSGKPVFNFRSDGRSFARADRCLIPADGVFEFTAPADPKQKRKDKHLFTLAGEPWFFIAGLVRDGAFSMLTTPPGPDLAPFHDRQVAVLPPAAGPAWLTLSRPEAELLRPLPAGAFLHEPVS